MKVRMKKNELKIVTVISLANVFKKSCASVVLKIIKKMYSSSYTFKWSTKSKKVFYRKLSRCFPLFAFAAWLSITVCLNDVLLISFSSNLSKEDGKHSSLFVKANLIVGICPRNSLLVMSDSRVVETFCLFKCESE